MKNYLIEPLYSLPYGTADRQFPLLLLFITLGPFSMKRAFLKSGIALLTAITAGVTSAATIDSVDFEALPVGATTTLTGTELANVTRVSFLSFLDAVEADFRSISETSLEVDYPADAWGSGDMLLVETTTGTTVTNGSDPVDVKSFTGNGLYSDELEEIPENGLIIVVESGAVLKGFDESSDIYEVETIYVKAGGALQVTFNLGDTLVFAEDGALLDFREASQSPTYKFSPTYYYSPNTEILGKIPPIEILDGEEISSGRQTTSISLSPGIGPFRHGAVLNLAVEGAGSVTRDIPGPYYERGTSVTLTAEPDAGQFFIGWSGAVNSTEPTITVRAYNSSVVATFSSDSSSRILKTYSGLGGQIIRTPDKDTYEDGETVTLTAQAADGFEFLGWGGDLMSLGDSLELTMNQNTKVVGIFRSLAQDNLPVITSADHEFIPVGETITLSGSGFTGPTKASFISIFATEGPVREISDTSLEVDYQAWSASDDHLLLLETAGGSTITSGMETEDFGSFDGVGLYSGSERVIVVEPGAILEGFSHIDDYEIEMIYVKAGGVVKIEEVSNDERVIFAEDGAILDFQDYRNRGGFSPIAYYSPNTEIIGDIPSDFDGNPLALALTSISISPGVGPFTQGVRLGLSIEGAGSVSRSIPGPYYERGTYVELTAEPEAGHFFTGWSGARTSTNPTITLQVPDASIVASFSSGRILTTYTGLGGQVIRTPEKEVYSDGETVTLTPQTEDGFEFLGWGGDLSSTENSLELSMTQDTQIVAIFRSLTQDSLLQITGADHVALPEGETITLSGSGFTGPTKASFIWGGQTAESSVREVSDNNVEVDYQAAWSASDDHMLLLETATGSTITTDMGTEDIGSFDGVGLYSGSERVIVVEPGAILEGFSHIDDYEIEIIYVKAGGILKIKGVSNDERVIFAEDGAILDFQGSRNHGGFSPIAYYSPNTEIIGEIPFNYDGDPIALELTPISISPGVGPFTEAFSVSLLIEGPGSVTGFDETVTYFKRGESLNLTATPTDGNHFIRWTGSANSSEQELNITVGRGMVLTARFSSLADFVSDWRGQNFTPEQLADPAIAGLNADPDNDGNDNTTEYVFGGNPLEADNGAGVIIERINGQEKSIEFSYLRPRFIADVEYRYLGSSDLTSWTPLSESGAIDEVSTTIKTDKLERVYLKKTFTEDLPSSYSIRITATLQ